MALEATLVKIGQLQSKYQEVAQNSNELNTKARDIQNELAALQSYLQKNCNDKVAKQKYNRCQQEISRIRMQLSHNDTMLAKYNRQLTIENQRVAEYQYRQQVKYNNQIIKQQQKMMRSW